MGNIKRHTTEICPQITITASTGSAYDLTDCAVKFILYYSTTLSGTVNSTDTHISVPVAAADVVEVNDEFLIDHERMLVSVVPTLPVSTSTINYTVSRGYTTPNAQAVVYGSTAVSGDGDNIFVMDTDMHFSLATNDTAATVVWITENSTTDNSTMANLVTDVQAQVDSYIGGGVTVSNIANKLTFTTYDSGETSYIAITAPDTESGSQLGLVAASDYGEDSVATTAIAHDSNSNTLRAIKIETDAIVTNATSGIAKYEWKDGETDKTGTFLMEFEVKTTGGRYFTAPNDESFSVTIIADANDRNLLDGE